MLTWNKGTAVVSGGSGALGLEIVREFLEVGMNVAICSSTLEKGKEALNSLDPKYHSSCTALGCHVDEPEEVKYCLEMVNAHFGSIDVIVNGAGAPDERRFGEIGFEAWKHCISSNLTGAFVMTKESKPYLIKSSSPRIINLGSVDGRTGGYEGGYGAASAKGGIISLTRAAARELAVYGITVNCVAPGALENNMNSPRSSLQQADIVEKIPLRRLGRPMDVAPAVCFLASNEACYITGSVIDVNGGLFMG